MDIQTDRGAYFHRTSSYDRAFHSQWEKQDHYKGLELSAKTLLKSAQEAVQQV